MNPVSSCIVIVFLAGFHIINVESSAYVDKRCRISDPNFDECEQKNVQEFMYNVASGIPELEIPRLDPFEIEKLVLGEGHSNGAPLSLSLTFKNVKVTGVKNIQVLPGTRYQYFKGKFEVVGLIPTLQIEGMYSMDGRVLLLPISGAGHANITVGDLSVKYACDVIVYKREDGVRMFRLENVKVDLQPKTCSIHFDNLFNGDKSLGDTMNNFLNENWRDVWEEFGPAIRATATLIVKEIFFKGTNHLTFDEVFLD